MIDFLSNKNVKKFFKASYFHDQIWKLKYFVMVFEFCHILAFVQYLIRKSLFNFLYRFLQAHFDNVLIHSTTA